MKYRIGLDIGIGSVGWAVINEEKRRIEDFGVRIFESGESPNGKDRASQERHGFRSVRRLERRRVHRKELLKNHLIHIGFIRAGFEDEYAAVRDADVHTLKVKGLDEKLSPAELFKCLVHTCNHRGYQDFYEGSIEDNDVDEESAKNQLAVRTFSREFAESGCRTVSEYLIQCFPSAQTGQTVAFRNIDSRKEECFRLIPRKLLREEVKQILAKQREYYPCLMETPGRVGIEDIIFRQRDFETGPGDENDPFRRYTGFLASLGKCPFNNEEDRCFRCSVIADLYAVANTLSQYRYVELATGELVLKPEIAQKLLQMALENGSLSMADVKKLLKANGFQLQKSENSDDKALSKAIKYLKAAKTVIEASGLSWPEFISEEQLDPEMPSKLHRIGEIIFKYQTPRRRIEELKMLDFLNTQAVESFSKLKLSGTANAGPSYMCAAIKSFCKGEIYGYFQANFIKGKSESAEETHDKLSAADIADKDMQDNPVVFRSINETRKIVNAIIEVYGTPNAMFLEVASDLNRSYLERQKIIKAQRENEKANNTAKQEVAKLLGINSEEVRGESIERYKLYEQQGGVSLYSGKPLGDIARIVDDKNHSCEIDHIVPYSLILDNTLQNKALVLASENQYKGQRTPLMVLSGQEREDFLVRVKQLLKDKKISDKKYGYLMQDNLRDNEKLSQWKSRNINDTRYITKYIMNIFARKLKFAGEGRSVYAVKGSLTAKFRKIWLAQNNAPLIWGEEDKARFSYLNHAVDAVIVANLSPVNIEIASENQRLYRIWKHHNRQVSEEYTSYLEACVKRLKEIYGLPETVSRPLLGNIKRVPAYLHNLYEEVHLRFDSETEEELLAGCREIYGSPADFPVAPHLPIPSLKPERRFRGAIADANPIRVVEEDGETYKVSRKRIDQIKASDLPNIRSNDKTMLKKLEEIFTGRGSSFTVGDYLKEQGQSCFTLGNGRTVFKVSVRESRNISNFQRKEISECNYYVLGGLKCYCLEVYEDAKGKTKLRGVRYVDLVRKDKKLLIKEETLPADYARHCMYLFKNDYIEIIKKNGNIKSGFYQSAKNTNENRIYFKPSKPIQPDKTHEPINAPETIDITIGGNDRVKKYAISLLGQKGGEVRCSEPYSFIGANE